MFFIEKLKSLFGQDPSGTKGVTRAKIKELETLIGAKLPVDFVSFYKVTDGIERFDIFVEDEELLSFEGIMSEWKIWKDLYDKNTFIDRKTQPAKGIRTDWWHPLWLPITYDGYGNHYCLDLAPAEGGTYGQIIKMWHDDTERPLIAKSFVEWITVCINEYKQKNGIQ